MTPTTKKIVGSAGTVVVLLGFIGIWHISHKPKNPLVDTTEQGGARAIQNVGSDPLKRSPLADRLSAAHTVIRRNQE
jgi:hypothetical protein